MQRFNHARGRLLAALAAVLALACGAGTAEAQTGPGFKTSQAPMLVPIVPGALRQRAASRPQRIAAAPRP